MKIKKTLSKSINIDNKELKYIYRIIEETVLNRQAFGIEIERQDFNNGEISDLERDYVNIVAIDENKANEILVKLYDNEVSPIHLVDIVGEYSDNCIALNF